MAASRRILWIDNDAGYLRSFQKALQVEKYEVAIVETVSDASKSLANNNYDLVILDVMIPMSARDEAEGYSGELTNQGQMTGLAFYIRNRDVLRRLSVMVLTARIDQAIVDEFVAAGLPRECLVTKYELCDVGAFLGKVRSMIDARIGTRKSTEPRS